MQTCKHDSDDYSSCLRLAIQEAWPNIVPGIKNGTLIIFLFELIEIIKEKFSLYLLLFKYEQRQICHYLTYVNIL